MSELKFVGVIPARYQSTRFPGKPLALIQGKPMLQWVVEAAKQSGRLEQVIVATDHGEIFELAEKVGAVAVMTAESLPSGTDRVYAATLNEDCDVVINIQGDEPLLKPAHIEALVRPFLTDTEVDMSTLGGALNTNDLANLNVVKLIQDSAGNAIYFSRFPIPYSRLDAPHSGLACYQHYGLYAYRKSVLKEICMHPQVALEKAESLEQLRALFLGKKIRVEIVNEGLHGVDSPDDIDRIASFLE